MWKTCMEYNRKQKKEIETMEENAIMETTDAETTQPQAEPQADVDLSLIHI